MHPKGGFYAALDADSEGVEGKYYTWTHQELLALLEEEERWIIPYFSCTLAGNWHEENTNVFYISEEVEEELLRQYSASELSLERDKILSKLLQASSLRVPPLLDNKMICSWNALLIESLVEAYLTFKNDIYLDVINKNILFFEKHFFIQTDELYRIVNGETTKIAAFLEDYAATISMYIRLYSIAYNDEYLHRAKHLTEHCLEHFYDANKKMFRYSKNSPNPKQLLAAKYELEDQVIPASNSMMAHNLHTLSGYFKLPQWKEIALSQLQQVIGKLKSYHWYRANWMRLLKKELQSSIEITILGNESVEAAHKIQQLQLSNCTLMASKDGANLELFQYKEIKSETLIYLCIDKQCFAPFVYDKNLLKTIQEYLH